MPIQGDIVKDYLERFPTSPTLTIAKTVYKENKEAFKDVEAVRGLVRYYRGQHGDANREAIIDKSHFTPQGVYDPFEAIPEGQKDLGDFDPVYIKGKHILVLGDIHVPYHDKKALTLALKHGQEKKVDTVLFLGDFADHYQISRFVKDPRQRQFSEEVDMVEYMLELIRCIFPNADIIWKLGNHDERYEIYLKIKAPEVLNIRHFSYEEVYHTDEYGVQVVGNKKILKVGKHLHLLHGHELLGGASSPVNPARGLFMKCHANAMCAHHHHTSQHNETTVGGKHIATWSIGCLSDLHPGYMPINKWNHGFARIRRDGDDFQVRNYRIIDNEIYGG